MNIKTKTLSSELRPTRYFPRKYECMRLYGADIRAHGMHHAFPWGTPRLRRRLKNVERHIMFHTPLYISSNTYTQMGIGNLPPYTILFAYSLNICSLWILTERILQAWGTRWCIWFRHCATSRNVAGSITRWGHWDSWLNSSGRTMALGSASTRNEYQGSPGG